MNTTILIFITLLVYFLHIVASIPVQDIEERRRKNKRRRRPCKRQDEESGRWFFGHDLTVFFGDVTICGQFPHTENTGSSSTHNSGLYDGVVPQPHRPHHRPHKPHRPILGNQHNMQVKPVEENVEEDYVQDEYYKPGPLVGVLNNNVVGQEQNLSNLNNYTPSRIFSTISSHFNRIVNPFIDLFYR